MIVGLPRSVVILITAAALAVGLGYLLATPFDASSFLVVVGVLLLLLSPILLRSHYLLLVASWGSYMVFPFLPGQPKLGIAMAAFTFGVAWFTRSLRREHQMISVRSVGMPLLALTAVVLATAMVHGGVGGRAFGSELWGAKRYFGVFGAVLGYFALTTQPIPKERARLYSVLFFLSGVTAVVSDIIYAAGEKFYPIYAFFASDLAALQAVTEGTLYRLNGLTFASLAGCFCMLLLFGIRGLLDVKKPWRQVLMLAMASASLLGGYRSAVILLIVVIFALYYYEGLLISRQAFGLFLSALLVFAFLRLFAQELPLSVQRSISFLPVKVDETAARDAMGTLDWRVLMWKTVLPEVPRHLLVGRGFAFSGTDYYLTQEAMRRGLYSPYEDTLISGNYHNGILTILIPFGIGGLICFLWFAWASMRVLRNNYTYGDPDLAYINRFLLAYFAGRLAFYLIFYGQLDLDLYMFTGTVGLSVAINGGVANPRPEVVPEVATAEPAVA